VTGEKGYVQHAVGVVGVLAGGHHAGEQRHDDEEDDGVLHFCGKVVCDFCGKSKRPGSWRGKWQGSVGRSRCIHSWLGTILRSFLWTEAYDGVVWTKNKAPALLEILFAVRLALSTDLTIVGQQGLGLAHLYNYKYRLGRVDDGYGGLETILSLGK
jgi:hypothetical protein